MVCLYKPTRIETTLRLVCFHIFYLIKTEAVEKAHDYDSALWREVAEQPHVFTTSAFNAKLTAVWLNLSSFGSSC
jgi:hypothetical protein